MLDQPAGHMGVQLDIAVVENARCSYSPAAVSQRAPSRSLFDYLSPNLGSLVKRPCSARTPAINMFTAAIVLKTPAARTTITQPGSTACAAAAATPIYQDAFWS